MRARLSRGTLPSGVATELEEPPEQVLVIGAFMPDALVIGYFSGRRNRFSPDSRGEVRSETVDSSGADRVRAPL
jgi:hypothetical protein